MKVSTIELKAEVARRTEDSRIAWKHLVEASARTSTPENVRAWQGASDWYDACREAERVARMLLIRRNAVAEAFGSKAYDLSAS